MLEEFLGREVMAPIYSKGWVDVMVDVDRDSNGKQLNERLMAKRSGGLPWMIVLDADGKELACSNAESAGNEGKNIGGPRADWEQAWFVEMLRRSSGKLVSEAELQRIAADLAEYSQPKPAPKAPAKPPTKPVAPSGSGSSGKQG